jgi:hypothetical protein
MKRFAQWLSVLVVVVLALGAPLLAFGQGGGDLMCAGLSDEDCEFLLASQQNAASATSFAIPSLSVSFSLDDGTQTNAFSATGSGHVMLPTSGSLLLHLVFEDITVEPADEEVPARLELLVNDTMYFVNDDGEWYGEELSDENKETVLQVLGAANPAALSSLGESGLDLTGILTTTRGEDAEVVGMTAASYKTDINVGKLLVAVLSSPMLGTLLGDQGAELGLSELSPEDMAMMGAIFEPMLTGTTISIEQWYGADDQFLHKIALDVVINLNLAMFSAEGGGEPITGGLTFEAELGEINETFEVAAPDSFKPIDEWSAGEQLEGMGSMGM